MEFGNPFSVKDNDRMLNHGELVRAIRMMVAAEYEATQLYEQLAASTDNTLASQVLLDIADEEKVHAGEFLRLLKELAPEEEGFYQQGAEEVEEEFLGGTSKLTGTASQESGSLGIGSLKGRE
ncbi:ferritin family protein [Sediminispirochaeta bajacaliforniensis]|uniref:ferritin family protein n=1 Tax=Sediminispirochaeta bajacaliforniensis TaxID=148 RepID=UPI000378BD7F|nr:ferritin family protein [Sediminispirochaeta bajacaliforniensis]